MPALFTKAPSPPWPSPQHKTCDNPKCVHPNPPQCVEGRYSCQGIIKRRPCPGSYVISLTTQISLKNSCSNPKCFFDNPAQCAEGTFECQGRVKNRNCHGTYQVSLDQVHAVDQRAAEYWRQEDRKRREDASWRALQYIKEHGEQKRQEMSLMQACGTVQRSSEMRRAKQVEHDRGLKRRDAQRDPEGRGFSPPPFMRPRSPTGRLLRPVQSIPIRLPPVTPLRISKPLPRLPSKASLMTNGTNASFYALVANPAYNPVPERYLM
ncbi:hypothetical protein C8J56DRAFT_929822 [Mycena floridula]|nr:hypothetical protein C8J56DRAFT_929822 [Mycena floridula]